MSPVERWVDVDVDDGYRLWTRATGPADATPLLLVMGANSAGVVWPEELVDRLAERHRVVLYDHRDTGRSTWAFAERPYAIRDLASDALSVLDAHGLGPAHLVGMSMGGTLVQVLLADHPERLRSATVFCTQAVSVGWPERSDVDLPGPDPRLLSMWEEMGEPREPEAELAWRVEHWRLLNGDVLPFDPEVWRQLELRVSEHAGRSDSPSAHALADQSGLERGEALARSTVPCLVIEAPADPINPPPHAAHLAETIGSSRLVTIEGMGHALHPKVLAPLGDAILARTGSADRGRDEPG